MMFRATALATATALAASPAFAQGLSEFNSAAQSAASAITSHAKDSLLVADLIGSEVTSPSGETVGTVSNLVAIPGGRLVAVLVSPSGGGSPVAIPYKLVKMKRTGGKAAVQLPAPLSDIKNNDAVRALEKAIGGISSGT